MFIEVGTALSMKGSNYVCTEIEQVNIKRLAKDNSEATKKWALAGDNVKVLESEVDEFEAGEIIHVTGERLIFENPGIDIQFVWSRYCVKKLKGDKDDAGKQGVESNNEQGSDTEVEGLGERDSGGEGDGSPHLGEASGSLHGHGSSGEAGDVVHPGDGEAS